MAKARETDYVMTTRRQGRVRAPDNVPRCCRRTQGAVQGINRVRDELSGRTHRTVHSDFALTALLRVSLQAYTLNVVVQSERLKELFVRRKDCSKKFLLSRKVLIFILLRARRRAISIPIDRGASVSRRIHWLSCSLTRAFGLRERPRDLSGDELLRGATTSVELLKDSQLLIGHDG